MNRRDFLLLRTQGSDRVLELSCERLYMQYVDAQSVAKRRGEEIDGMTEAPWWVGEPPTSMDGPDAEGLFRELQSDLADADVLQVRDREWLVTGDFRDRLEALLGGFRARGGRVVAIGCVLAGTLFGCAPRGPSDEVLRERVEVVLANASDLPEEIEVEVSDGVVTLTGSLLCEDCGGRQTPGGFGTIQQSIGAVVRAVPGVESVEFSLAAEP